LFAVAAVAALAVDLPLARSALSQSIAGDVRRVLDISEVFAHGCGVLLILVTAAVLDPAGRPQLARVSACAFGAGGLVQVIKHVVPRVRPYAFQSPGDVFSTFGFGWDASAAQTAAAAGSPAVQSFPSGHTATAVGLAFGLAWLYPRGRWLFALFAALAAAQRVQSSAHFLSDTLAAAAIAGLVAGICLSERGIGAWFTRFEQSRARRGPASQTDPGVAAPPVSSSPRRYVA
jgi:membrane-associated phospholipid phosphatase